ncbi:MAG: RibD family protein [Pseudomonadota bacterium]
MSTVSVTLKIATSMDARIALADGTSQWITGPAARARSHAFRAAHDAVLVGVGTVLADDPLLTARTVPAAERQPVRIIMDSYGRTPLDGRLMASTSVAPVVIATAGETGALHGRKGASVWPCAGGDGRVSPTEVVRRASVEGIGSIMVEGGGQVAAAFLRAGLVDRIEWFMAPIVIGGDGLPAVAALGLEAMAGAPRYRVHATEPIGDDVLTTYVRS